MTSETLGRSILVVEDDDELRRVLRSGLREEGFVVETVATGADALARVESAPPDLVVIDIGLPDTDGRDLC
jgi:DNA-binding response OmpR family regulator